MRVYSMSLINGKHDDSGIYIHVMMDGRGGPRRSSSLLLQKIKHRPGP